MCTEKKKSNRVLLKVSLYFMSLWSLMAILIVLKIDVSMIGKKKMMDAFKDFFCANMFSVLCLFVIIIGLIGYVCFKDYLNNAKGLPVEIKKCESLNYENLSFLATYVIPLICFPMETKREIFVLFTVIIVIGCIFVKTNLYYTNPSLALMGFNVYRVHCKDERAFKEGIVIVKGELHASDTIKYMELSDNVYFVRRVK